jgi:TatD DNase family protein
MAHPEKGFTSEEILIDTHAHLDFPDYDTDREAVLRRAREAGVRYIITIGTDVARTEKAIAIAREHPDVYATVGVHPHYADDVTDETWGRLKRLADDERVVAIGEVGLDNFKLQSSKEAQRSLFERMLGLSREKGLPVIVHCREAFDDVLKILTAFASGDKLRGVVHCFSGSIEQARACMELGLCISFTGNITFKKAENLRAVAKEVPVEKMLLETDCPFLAPVPKRGKRNEPAYVTHIARLLAELKGLSLQDVARITTLSAYELFGVGPKPETSEIVYGIRNSLYVNLTNRCSNNCAFCIRNKTAFVKGHHLYLEREPTVGEVLDAVGDPKRYEEVVFCGYGEPTERFDDLKKIARMLKERGARVRLVTNGEGALINGRQIASELNGLVDKVSVSINTAEAGQYNELCRSRYGESAFPAAIEFVREAREHVPEVEITALDLPDVDIQKARRLAEELGTKFRLRHYNEVG